MSFGFGGVRSSRPLDWSHASDFLPALFNLAQGYQNLGAHHRLNAQTSAPQALTPRIVQAPRSLGYRSPVEPDYSSTFILGDRSLDGHDFDKISEGISSSKNPGL